MLANTNLPCYKGNENKGHHTQEDIFLGAHIASRMVLCMPHTVIAHGIMRRKLDLLGMHRKELTTSLHIQEQAEWLHRAWQLSTVHGGQLPI